MRGSVWAKTKGKVERPFRYIREDFFLARSFRNLDDLNAQFRQWLDGVANARTAARQQCCPVGDSGGGRLGRAEGGRSPTVGQPNRRRGFSPAL
jgi:hypothetical protein